MQGIAPKVTTDAAQALIEWGVFGAGFVLMLGICVAFLWWIIRHSAKEVRIAREELAESNRERAEAAEATTRVNTLLIERLSAVITSLDSVLDAVGADHVKEDDTQAD